jgi:ADP-ribose pyrophosphatase YjhB (NUDIX family)
VTRESDSDGHNVSIPDLNLLRNDPAVEVLQEQRAFEQEQFEGLRKRYETIDGVVQVGVTTDSGDVLLVGPDGWAPPGGSVMPGEDWAGAARRSIRELTGVEIRINRVKRLVESKFCLESDESSHFYTASAIISASLSNQESSFLDDPTVAEDLDHEIYGTGEDIELAWFDTVPKDVDPNHVEDIELLLD